MFRNAILAGTFDLFHAGHKALFRKALASAEHVTVGITSDSFARRTKRRKVTPFSTRKSRLVRFLGKDAARVSFHRLEDAYGYSTYTKDADSIVVSPETEPMAVKINHIREADGLAPLSILLVPMVRGQDSRRISSTRIANGEIDADGKSLGKTGKTGARKSIYKQPANLSLIPMKGKRHSKKKKGQIFTTDFMISVAVFIGVLITIITLWNGIDIHIKEVESRREMHSIAISVSDALIRSPGFPPSWNSTNVQSIGLAKEEYVLDQQKLMSLIGLDYDTARSIMRLGNYHMLIYVSDISGHNVSSGVLRSPVAYFCNSACTLQDSLNDSGLVWDIYQVPGPALPSIYNFRAQYVNSLPTPEHFFNQTTAGLSGYKSLLLEEPLVTNSRINITGLQQFLENGGVILVKAQGTPGYNVIDQNFSMHSENVGSTNGVVNRLDLVIQNASIGSTIAFSTSSWRYYSGSGDVPIISLVNDSADSTKCLVCSWTYGRGKIYFVEDFNGRLNPPGGPLLSQSNSLNFIGKPLKYGTMPSNESIDVISINRVAVMEGIFREPVAIHIIVWRLPST